MHIIGHGRYARETYPERSNAIPAGTLVRVGYDQTIDEFQVVAPGSPPFLQRNAAGAPMTVTFPAFALGNTLEVDFKLNAIEVDAPEPTIVEVSTLIAVSVDGGVIFYNLVPSAAVDKVDLNSDDALFLRSLDSIKIVNPMPVVVSGVPGTTPVTAPPIVRVFYSLSDPGASFILNGGTDEISIPGAILRCSELLGPTVFQGPFGQLALD